MPALPRSRARPSPGRVVTVVRTGQSFRRRPNAGLNGKITTPGGGPARAMSGADPAQRKTVTLAPSVSTSVSASAHNSPRRNPRGRTNRHKRRRSKDPRAERDRVGTDGPLERPDPPPGLWWIDGSAVTTTNASSITMKYATAASKTVSTGPDACAAGPLSGHWSRSRWSSRHPSPWAPHQPPAHRWPPVPGPSAHAAFPSSTARPGCRAGR
jgi:hypothetical protein